jgi:hypothetical protein
MQSFIRRPQAAPRRKNRCEPSSPSHFAVRFPAPAFFGGKEFPLKEKTGNNIILFLLDKDLGLPFFSSFRLLFLHS